MGESRCQRKEGGPQSLASRRGVVVESYESIWERSTSRGLFPALISSSVGILSSLRSSLIFVLRAEQDRRRGGSQAKEPMDGEQGGDSRSRPIDPLARI